MSKFGEPWDTDHFRVFRKDVHGKWYMSPAATDRAISAANALDGVANPDAVRECIEALRKMVGLADDEKIISANPDMIESRGPRAVVTSARTNLAALDRAEDVDEDVAIILGGPTAPRGRE